ncbi:uncharacterized protein FPRO_05906 [Fusarium proliferatum ET1]|uniref:Related to hsp70 protein n=1 Tax=Fusarium proliferatum (strain ET1) TaxID=1227346 RepID=A0A1L7VF69_FUSPR|nr:uncharacterized protein FPRO_05906 [Fusarium proliferatum ET1]CZR38902.1 related to hsp70 protein [Fusarium proliferatum ET1]
MPECKTLKDTAKYEIESQQQQTRLIYLGFKLDLDLSTQAVGHNTSAEGVRSGRNTDELVTDLIAQLVEHLMYTLREKLGSGLVNSTPLQFFITVPAIWSDLAKEKTMKASDVHKIFEPVVLEVIRLVKDQITAGNVPVQAILLVGGFGSSNYLKERLRAAIDSSVRILQPPNAWQAIVQGAVLKGLALSSPDSTVVKVENRKARKHYGTEWSVRWDEKSPKSKERKILGSTVSENEPYIAAFVWTNPVSKGRIRTVRMTIYNDPLSRDAPLSRNDNVGILSIVEADVNHIPENQLRRRKGCDGQWYYELNCKI